MAPTLSASMRVQAFLVFLVTLCASVRAVQPPPVAHIEGTTRLTSFGPDGSVVAQQEPNNFCLWISECKWAVRLYGNTNLPNGITDVSCDGTNLYVFVPDAGGTHLVRGSPTPFAQSGSVYPGRIKVFPMEMGPIWWAYCSSCVIERDGPIFDFMDLTLGRPQSRSTVNVRLVETNKTAHRIGAVGACLLADDSAPLAYLQPVDLRDTEGLTLLTSCKVLIYSTTDAPKQMPQVRYEYLITVKDFGLKADGGPFVPAITKPALVSDYRAPMSGQYLTDHWLSAEERRAALRTPVAEETMHMPRVKFQKIALFLLIVLPLAGVGFARLLRARKARNKTN